MPLYRVIDLRVAHPGADTIAVETAGSPQMAAFTALGVNLVKSGATPDLAAKVYWQDGEGVTSVVRLYTKAGDRAARLVGKLA